MHLRVCFFNCLFLKRIRDVGRAAFAPVVSITSLLSMAGPPVQQDAATLQAHSQQVAAERRPSLRAWTIGQLRTSFQNKSTAS